MMSHKKDIREYIERKGEGKVKWIGIVNNPWTDYSLRAGMFGIDMLNKAFTRIEPQVKFYTTSLAQAGRAAAAVVLAKASVLERYENKLVLVNSFHVSQDQMFEAVLKASGTKEGDWKIGNVAVDDKIKGGQDAVKAGNFMGSVDVLYGSVMKEGLANVYGREVDNQTFGLPQESLDALVKEVVEGAS